MEQRLISSNSPFPEDARERILSQDYVSLIYHNETIPFRRDIILPEYLPQPVDWQYAVLNAPLDLYAPDIPAQGYFTIPKLYTLLDAESLDASGILELRNQPFFNLDGSRILLGFIDTGINYRHPAFRNPDGTTRIVSIWDQADQTGSVPAGFLYGSEYTASQINEALFSPDPLSLVPTDDENGHGTALAGIAAGTPDETAGFSGAAPGAGIVVVKLKPAKEYLRDYFLVQENAPAFQEDDCMLAVRYLQEQAQRLNLPLVVCFGLGTNQGGHDGHTPLDEVLLSMTFTAGRYSITAAGNETGAGHHYFGKVSGLGETDEVEITVEQENRGFTLELWSFAPDLFSLGIVTPLGEQISPADPRIGATQSVSFILSPSSARIDYEIVEFRSGSQLIQVRVENPPVGIWRFQAVSRRYVNGSFHMWLPITGLGSPAVRFLNPDPDTTLTVPGCSRGTVTVSTYQASSGALYLRSSRGFARDEQIKPDLAAPGVNIQAPYSSSSYRLVTGSSAAAAITAGAAALLVQWGKESSYGKLLSDTELKNLLYRGAGRDPALYYPNREWGYGTLDLYGIFESLIGF